MKMTLTDTALMLLWMAADGVKISTEQQRRISNAFFESKHLQKYAKHPVTEMLVDDKSAAAIELLIKQLEEHLSK